MLLSYRQRSVEKLEARRLAVSLGRWQNNGQVTPNRPKLSWGQYQLDRTSKEDITTARLVILSFIALVLYLCLR